MSKTNLLLVMTDAQGPDRMSAGPVTGVHAVYLVFRGHQVRALDLQKFSFENILGNR